MNRERIILWVGLAFVLGFIAGASVATLTGKKEQERPSVSMVPPSPLATAPPSIEDTEKIEEMKEELRKNPNDQQGWLRLGNKYEETRQVALAVDAFRHYLALKPGDTKVWTRLGHLLENSGDTDGAAKAFTKAAQDQPGQGRGDP